MNVREFLSIALGKPEETISDSDVSRLNLAFSQVNKLSLGDTSDLSMRLCAASIALNNVAVKEEVINSIKCDIYNDTCQLSLI